MTGPLEGVVVVDLSRVLAGPHAAMMLGDLGARVIKVEAEGGDETRQWGPPFAGDDRVSTYFLACNRNKESITLDLKSDRGRDVLTRLVRHADVVVENFRTGVLDRLGFPVERLHELNPGLVILSITGFGHDGPEGGRPGYDAIMQGEAGIMSVTGPPGRPSKTGLSICDVLAGMNGAYGVVAALYERTRTGRGAVVRTSLLASAVGAHAYQGSRWTVAGDVPESLGNDHPSIAPYGTFRCADGEIQIGVANEGLWRRFAPLVGLDPDDARFATVPDRTARRAELSAEIEKALSAEPRATWLARLDEAGIPAGSIRSIDEVYAWEQTRSQGLVVEVDHPQLGPIELPGPPLRFDDAPPREHTAPPLLGQHTERVLAWLDEVEG
ncbi:CaiB/BaiF CoA transferase family protein [Thermomonospora umbrina]|uniref:Crotonobetainyl-CoA:carnitine CoA-transferase CaiB-like acyl-CoA transferase n=1 Tax=Thermomonospora umbrina TaxID=111806 RepID=A0A3D9SIU8_9ACTN|nr:CoA transferase [Thermomonospora umbrina]REE95868.1 crotonobetainyl-CoA:carnitine CoA-transferase CaiB-like acyl-CoA transferase [Thermomonospora umbrina]